MREGSKHTEESRKKMSLAKVGKPCSEENKKKISLANTGRPCSKETRKKLSLAMIGSTNWLGKHHTEETKQKISRAAMGNTRRLGHPHSEETLKKISIANGGENNWNWKGGITPETTRRLRLMGWHKLAAKIRERDHDTCRVCGFRSRGEKGLDVHHIVPYRVSCDDSESNLLTVCKSCHMKLEAVSK